MVFLASYFSLAVSSYFPKTQGPKQINPRSSSLWVYLLGPHPLIIPYLSGSNQESDLNRCTFPKAEDLIRQSWKGVLSPRLKTLVEKIALPWVLFFVAHWMAEKFLICLGQNWSAVSRQAWNNSWTQKSHSGNLTLVTSHMGMQRKLSTSSWRRPGVHIIRIGRDMALGGL